MHCASELSDTVTAGHTASNNSCLGTSRPAFDARWHSTWNAFGLNIDVSVAFAQESTRQIEREAVETQGLMKSLVHHSAPRHGITVLIGTL